jgi:hypothetical protein
MRYELNNVLGTSQAVSSTDKDTQVQIHLQIHPLEQRFQHTLKGTDSFVNWGSWTGLSAAI